MVHKKERGRPRKAAALRQADRQALVAAAVSLIREGGIAAFSARGVAERADTALGSVYTQFESLEELRLEANAVTMRALRDALAGAMASCRAEPTEDRLLCLADAYIAFADEHRNAWAAMFERRSMEPPAAIAADIASLFAILERELRESGRIAGPEVDILAKALWSSVHGMVFLGNLGGLGPVRPDDVRPMIAALIGATVRGMRSAEG